MPNLEAIDWLVVLLSFFLVVTIGQQLRQKMKTSGDFLLAGRALPGWICGLSMAAAGLGSTELIAMGAAGARYGLAAAVSVSLGAVAALVFAGLFMMPILYGAKHGAGRGVRARTAPEYLGLRFGPRTRLLAAGLTAAVAVASAAISIYATARILQLLRIFDPLFYAFGWPRQGIFLLSVLLPAGIVMAYVLLGGLTGAMYNQVAQFFMVVAGFLPLAVLGARNIGGWSGFAASASMNGWHGGAQAGGGSPGAITAGLAAGIVFSAAFWLTDFRVLQAPMAARDLASARRAPLIAACARLLLVLLLVLPGMIAIGLPTPQSTTTVREQGGVIFHETTVVSREAAEGQGLVPARVDKGSGAPMADASGHAELNYAMATPEMLVHLLPNGLLGLGLAALLASLMSGLAASATAFSTVFTFDVYQQSMGRGASDADLLKAGRWAAAGSIVLAACAAGAVGAFRPTGLGGIFAALLLVISLVNAPMLVTFLLGMFWKRATGHGGFAGLLAGLAAALLHQGLTAPGFYAGWLGVAHRYPGIVAQCFWTAICAFAANLMVTVGVSLCTRDEERAMRAASGEGTPIRGVS